MQLKIDRLKRKLRHERRRRTPSNYDFSSNSEEDDSYRPRSRTPPSESFSYDEDYHHERKNKNSSSKSLGNDATSRVLNQISRCEGEFTPIMTSLLIVRRMIVIDPDQ